MARPTAYLHTLHMELRKKYEKLSFQKDAKAVFGKRGRDYDPSYFVTVEPLFKNPTPAASLEGCNAGVIASKKRLDVCRAWADLALENERLRDRAEAAIVAANALQARLDAAEAALREQVGACDTDDCEMCHRHRELLATSGSKATAALSATATEGE